MNLDLTERMSWSAVAIAVFAVCLGVASGHFHTIDEVSMFVTAANVVNRGEFHTNQLGWAQWANRPGEEQGLLSQADDVYSKKSPIVIALMIPLVALGRLLPSLGMIRAVLLLGPIFTTLTAAILYSTTRELGFNRASGATAALAFTVCTMALPYSRLAVGELVASLGILLAVRTSHRIEAGRIADSLLCGAGLALAIGANAAYVLFIPLFALVLVFSRRTSDPGSRHLLRLVIFGLPILIIGASLAGYNYLRFGSFLQTGYHFASGQEGFTTPLWWGALGLSLSPVRGFLWYNPPALLAFAGWPRFHRAHRPLSWLIILVTAAHLIIFGAWWEWWGGYGWGPRFLLPIVPCVLIVCLPIFQSATERSATAIARMGIGAVLAVGLAVQIVGTAIDFNAYEVELEGRFPVKRNEPLLYHHDPALVYDLMRSPIVAHFQRLTTSPLDFAWWSAAPSPTQIPEILAAVKSQPRTGDAIIYLVPELIDPLVTTSDLPPTFGLPVNVRPDDALANRLFDRALRDADRVWMITWYGQGDPGNWYEAYLRRNWASLNEQTLDGYRVVLFAQPPGEVKVQPEAASFGPLRLIGYAARIDTATLFVELHWRADEPPMVDYVTFVHVLGSDGLVVVGQDRQPLGGYRRTRTWLPGGESVIDRFAFSLTPEQLEGAHVEVGWYSWPSLQRLPLVDSSGNRVESDSLLLAVDR